MRNRVSTAFVAALLAMAIAAPASAAVPNWAPAETASIKPGGFTITDSGQCTSNFVFHDDGGDIYVGQAAHCSSLGQASDTNGCNTASMPLGTPVVIQGATRPGTLAYNSWLTMQQRGETDLNTCAHNDFALVKIHPDDLAGVNPSFPVWGGPTGLATSTDRGDKILTFTNSALRQDIAELKPQVGTSRGQTADGWVHTAYTILPGLPGDSGSGFLDDEGRAFGVLSTLNLLPRPLSNGIADLSRSLDYANRFGGLDPVELALGTEPFTGAVTPSDDVIEILDEPLSLLESLQSVLGLL